MDRRQFIKAAGLGAAALAVGALNDWTQASAAEGQGRPNILYFNADDFRADCIAALGKPYLKTPNFDKLVARGMFFTRAYTMGSMIGAVCLPSRTMMQTGRSVFHIPGGGGRAADAGAATAKPPCLGASMRAAGYETFHVGKGGNEYKAGIEAFETNIVRNDGTPEQRRLSSEGHADTVIKFLTTRSKDRPFFIYLAPPVPHDPRVAPQKFMDMYDPAQVPLPASYLPVHPFDNGEMTVRDEQLAPWPRTPEVVRRHLADYYSCITNQDYHFGRILDCLETQGQLENTIIVFTGDNGLSLGEHGLMGKQNLYEFGGMHVPMLMAGPGIPQGKTDAFVYLMDLYPTFCEMGGAKAPAEVEGHSLLPIVQGKAKGVRDEMFTLYRDCQRAVRDDRWKLIRYPLVDQTQLFDLQADPHELNNLADKPENAAKVKEMTELLQKLQKQYDDKYPLRVEPPKPAAWTPPAAGASGAAARKAKKKKARKAATQ